MYFPWATYSPPPDTAFPPPPLPNYSPISPPASRPHPQPTYQPNKTNSTHSPPCPPHRLHSCRKFAHLIIQLLIRPQIEKFLPHSLPVPRLHKEAVLPVLNLERDTACFSGDHRARFV